MLCVRLTLVDRAGEHANIYVDVFVASDRSLYDKVITHGRWGDLKDEPWPFALQPRATGGPALIDFGTGVEEAGFGRTGSINLFAKKLTRGELTTFSYDNDEICFAIRDAKIMPDGEDYFLALNPAPLTDPSTTP